MSVIVRDGKIYTLTYDEMKQAYEEFRQMKWRGGIEAEIEANAENLRFSGEFTHEDFINECINEINVRIESDRNDYCNYSDIVFDIAQENEIWIDGV